MENKFAKIEDKLDKLDSRLDNLDIHMARNNVILEDHTRRSLANEKAVEILKDEIKPVVTHVAIMHVLGKIVLVLLGSSIVIEIIQRLMK